MANAADNHSHEFPSWLQNVAVSVLSWLSIGALGGAGFLTFAVPNRLNQIDSNQQAALIRLTAIEKKHNDMMDDIQNLTGRVIRLESRP